MTAAVQPRLFTTARHLDPEDINANLLAAQRDVNANLAKRYTYSTMVMPLTGMANTDGAGVRTFVVAPPLFSNSRVEIVGVECSIAAAVGATWTLTASTPGVLLSIVTQGATTAVGASASTNIPVTSSESLVLSASAGSTIAGGFLVVHLRSDRGDQGASPNHAGFTPTLYDSATSTAGATADAQLAALAAAVARDTNNDVDLRVECYAIRGLGSGAAVTFQCPSGARRLAALRVSIAATAGRSVTGTVGGGVTGCSAVAPATSTAVTTTGQDTTFTQSIPDDPMDVTDDTTVTLTETSGTGTVELVYATLWWS